MCVSGSDDNDEQRQALGLRSLLPSALPPSLFFTLFEILQLNLQLLFLSHLSYKIFNQFLTAYPIVISFSNY